MPEQELEVAMDAIRKQLQELDSASLPTLIERLTSEPGYREDAIRRAFWALVGEGEIHLNKEFKASSAQAAA